MATTTASKKKTTRKTTSSGIVTRSASRASVVADRTLREGDIGLSGNIGERSSPVPSLTHAAAPQPPSPVRAQNELPGEEPPISPEEVSAQLPPSPTPDHEDQLRPDSVAEMCRELYDTLITRMDETDEVIRNASRFANTALRDVASAQQRAADVRERTRTTFKRIWQQLDRAGVRLEYPPDPVRTKVSSSPSGTPSALHSRNDDHDSSASREKVTPSPILRDEDYTEPELPSAPPTPRPLTLEETFAPRRPDEDDAHYVARVQLQDRFLERQGIERRRREREAQLAQRWQQVVEKYGDDPYVHHHDSPQGYAPPSGPPDDGGNDNDDDPFINNRRASQRAPRTNGHMNRGRREPSSGREGPPPPPPAGGPSGDGGGDDDDDDDDDEPSNHDSDREPSAEREDRNPRPEMRGFGRHFSRSPTYLIDPRASIPARKIGRSHTLALWGFVTGT